MSSIDDLPKQSQSIKRNFEECAEVNDSPKEKDIWYSELTERSYEDFDDIHEEWFAKTSTHKQNYDYQLYGKLLINKLRTYSVYERKILMFKIKRLLIKNPPGFDTSSTKIEAEQSSRKSVSSSSPAVNLHSSDSDKAPTSPSKKLKQEFSQTVQISNQSEGSGIKATEVNSIQSMSKVNNDISIQPATDSSHITNQLIKITSSIQKHPPTSSVVQHRHNNSIRFQPIKVTTSSSIQNQPIKVLSSTPNQPVKVTNKPVKVPNIPNQPKTLQASSSVPPHLPLHITIPENKLAYCTLSNYVVSSSHPKGKIILRKSKSANYTQCQPPILITVPSLSPVRVPTLKQCSMNPLELLSSIAVSCASQIEQNQMSCDVEENGTSDKT